MKKLTITAITLASLFVLWLAGSVFLTLQSSSLIFNNRVSWSPVPEYGYKLDFVKNKAGQNLSIWTFSNPGTDQYILYFHGNAGRLPNFFQPLLTKANLITIAYPGYHESEGSPTTENVYESTELVYDWLTRQGISESNITILGHSMGGSPATYLASKRPNAKQLFLINTFSSVQSMCFKSYSIFCFFAGNIFNTAVNAEKVILPVRQFGYRGDDTVSFEEGEKLYKYFSKSNDKKFVELTGFTHSYPNFDQILEYL
jgi:pimeloyl-ACP methyl ester carboxylesterase